MSATYDVVPSLYKALSVIQHRGQESAGISVFNGETTETVKGNGLVSVALSDDKLSNVAGNCGIGHVRYSTTGSKAAVNAQPLTVDSTFGTIAIAHNGDVTNFSDLKNEYMKKGWSFLTDSDSEMVARILSKYLTQTEDFIDAIAGSADTPVSDYVAFILEDDRFKPIIMNASSTPSYGACLLILPKVALLTQAVVGSTSAARTLTIDLGGNATSISEKGIVNSEQDAWYSIDGRRLSSRPTAKGIYIHNGHTVVVQ